MVAVCAVVAGAETFENIALYGRCADTSLRASLKGKRKTAAWDDAYMARLLRG